MQLQVVKVQTDGDLPCQVLLRIEVPGLEERNFYKDDTLEFELHHYS